MAQELSFGCLTCKYPYEFHWLIKAS